MFKIPLLQNKEMLLTIGVGIGLFLMLIVNVVSLVPKIIDVYSLSAAPANTSPIDAASVNKAIELLSE